MNEPTKGTKTTSKETGAEHEIKIVRGRAILTFDDGPLGAVSQILGILATREIKGYFYLTGEEVATEAGGKAAADIVKQGHGIGNHSYSHDQVLYSSKTRQEISADIRRAQAAILQATGVSPQRMRPPYGEGFWRKDFILAVQENGLIRTRWDVDTNDWRKPKGLDGKRFDPPRSGWKKLYQANKKPLDILMHVYPETAADLNAFILDMMNDHWTFTLYE
jgi:peptidoglycan/xylan/chitin deacetylase (PgdA/CDA1 family)